MEVLNFRKTQLMKNRLIILISLIIVCCNKDSEENEIEENFESVGEIKKYEVSIISANGGSVNVSSGT